VKINGETHYLWRAIDHEGEILESYVTKTREKKAALAFMKKTLKRHGSPDAITIDGLASYKAAMRGLGNGEKQTVGRHANNRVENSQLPFRRRERAMLRFRQMKSLQKFASVHANVHNHFNPERHLVNRQTDQSSRIPSPEQPLEKHRRHYVRSMKVRNIRSASVEWVFSIPCATVSGVWTWSPARTGTRSPSRIISPLPAKMK
jgi:hypothetical protein